ncbi:hypothetical protein evm_008564 [Chilo suppressalis]|nr:hypothetical protein evm_008564 [Chilo suppressalis]
MPDIKIRQREVRAELQSLDVRKASGPDGIPAVVLKKCAAELSPVLTRLYQCSYSLGRVPETWRDANVQPVPKKGDRSDPANYRPIAVTSVLCKVLEKVLNNHLTRYLEDHSLINDRQYGFRPKRSTGGLLAYLTHIWGGAIDKRGESLAISLDIAKAFDRVWHKSLLSKLPAYCLPAQFCSWVADFLHERRIRVLTDGSSSRFMSVNAGVPQGSVLSPTLFLLHINDLIPLGNIHCYADDSTVHAGLWTTFPNGVPELVGFNAKKTQACAFTAKTSPFLPLPSLQGTTLPLQSNISMLGMEVRSDLNPKDYIETVIKTASRKLGVLNKRTTRAGLRCHCLTVATIPKRTKKFGDSFLCRTIRKWNALPAHVFPPSYNLGSFKRGVKKQHAGRQGEDGWLVKIFRASNFVSRYPRRVASCGYQTALTVIVNTDPDDYYSAFVASQGALVFIDDAYNMPDMDSPVRLMSPFTEVMIALSPERTYSTPGIKGFSPEQRQCYFIDEIKIGVFQQYSFHNCIIQQKVEYMKMTCRCVPFYFPTKDNYRVCNFYDIDCLESILKINEFPNMEDSGRKIQCLPECEHFNYHFEVALGTLSQNVHLNGHPFLDGLSLVNRSLLNVFFNDLVSTKYRRDVYLNWQNILASFGGLLSLMLGFTLISGFDLILYTFGVLYSYMTHSVAKKNSRVKKDISKEGAPEFYKKNAWQDNKLKTNTKGVRNLRRW